MNRQKAIERHKKRLANLTNRQVRNLMEHAANKSPLLAIDKMFRSFVSDGKC